MKSHSFVLFYTSSVVSDSVIDRRSTKVKVAPTVFIVAHEPEPEPEPARSIRRKSQCPSPRKRVF